MFWWALGHCVSLIRRFIPESTVVRFAQAHHNSCDLVPPYGREQDSWNHETLFGHSPQPRLLRTPIPINPSSRKHEKTQSPISRIPSEEGSLDAADHPTRAGGL